MFDMIEKFLYVGGKQKIQAKKTACLVVMIVCFALGIILNMVPKIGLILSIISFLVGVLFLFVVLKLNERLKSLSRQEEDAKKQIEKKKEEAKQKKEEEQTAAKRKIEREKAMEAAMEKEKELLSSERQNTLKYESFLEQLSAKIQGGSSNAGTLWLGFTPVEKKAAVILWIEGKIHRPIDLSNEGEKRLVEYTVNSLDKKGISKRNRYCEYVENALTAPLLDFFAKKNQINGLKNSFEIIEYYDKEVKNKNISFDYSYTDYKTELGAFYRNPDFWELFSRPGTKMTTVEYILRIFAAAKERSWGYKLINGGKYYPAGDSEAEKNNPNLETIWNIVAENEMDD